MKKVHIVAKTTILKHGQAQRHALVSTGGDADRNRNSDDDSPNGDSIPTDVDDTPAGVGARIGDFDPRAFESSG